MNRHITRATAAANQTLEATENEEAAPVKGTTEEVGDGRAPVPVPTGTVLKVEAPPIGYLAV